MIRFLCNISPFAILNTKDKGGALSEQIDGRPDKGNLLTALRLPQLVRQQYSVYITAIVLLCGLFVFLFVQKADILAEKKKDLLHKIFVFWLILSITAILNMVYAFARGLVGV